ncbi:MAG: CBS domain-containing protein [Alphaproteobacteria bacterium]|nr:CBS domain-containing protein [Alphaproteobacteria bacterium]
MNAKDIMSLAVCTASPDTPINHIAMTFTDRQISAVPVVDDENRVLGIVSEGDLLRRVELGSAPRARWLDLFASNESLAREFVKANGRTAKDVMTAPAITVDDTADVVDIAELLDTKRIKRVPVVRDGRLVGIVSRADIVRALIVAAKSWGRKREVDDKTIRMKIVEAIRLQPFIDADKVNVVVEDGEVNLWGQVESAAQRAAIRVIAENTRGVRNVADNLIEWKMQAYV